MNFGFKSSFTPPQHELLSPFGTDLYDMIRSINFKPVKNDFQKKLTEDTNNIKSSENLLVFADKTTNLYEMTPKQYKTTYRKAERSTKLNIDREAITISKTLHLEKRIERYAERPAFISLKDHKENFKHNTKCRLINPSKGEMGVVSKRFLEEIINKLNKHQCYNQWRSTSAVIDWFRAIENKKACKFIKFDIAESYPSISAELLEKSINFARIIIEIEDKTIDIINHARKSLLFHDGNAWVKKEGNPLYDVNTGSYSGAEVCELVGLYLLGKLAPLIGTKNVGLYRDDGLAVIHQANGPKMDRIRKDIMALFKSEGLSITIDTNLIETDFLDVSFNLEMDKFFPYRKPSNTPLYIHSESNHPPSIIKQLRLMTNKRISNLSCNEHEFNKAKALYESALKNSGFNYSMKFEAPVENARRNRNRKVIWFNPPYSLNVKTNIGKIFLKLGRKNFPRSHKLGKIFNLNTMKISYSSMPNVKNLIKQHNSKILNKDQEKYNAHVTAELKKVVL